MTSTTTSSRPGAGPDAPPRLAMTGISKRFGAVRAIRHADLSVRPGTVHALVGENGAGKSTMIKILAGVETADTGEVEVDGTPAQIRGTSDALALGVATVYQEPQLFAELTVSENIFIGRELQKGARSGPVDWAAQHAQVVEVLDLLGLPPRVATATVADLPIATQQQVSIAKALIGNARILILDEPSAILTDTEIEVLFTVVRRPVASGVSAIRLGKALSHRRSFSQPRETADCGPSQLASSTASDMPPTRKKRKSTMSIGSRRLR